MPSWLLTLTLSAIALPICAGCAAPGAAVATIAPASPTIAPLRPTAKPTPTAAPTAMPLATPTAMPSPAPTASPSATACGEQHGRMAREQLRSRAMGQVEDYRIYLPVCYSRQAGRRYPVIYLLHGGEHNEEHWDDVGVDDAADQLIAAGQIPPLLIVLPDGGQDFGPLRDPGERNSDSPPPFARYLHDELIPYVEATYHGQTDRAHRALGGISYGAAWALLLAARYPDSFSAIGAHSPAIGSFNGIEPDVQALCARRPRLYVDVGDRDRLRGPAADLHAALDGAGCPNEFHIFPGLHVESYWNRHLEQYLRFYTREW